MLSIALLLIALPLLSFAQQPPPGLVEVKEGTRRGAWFGPGVGVGGESNDAVGPGYSDPFYKPTISLRAGGTIGPHLRLGGEVLSWFDEEGDAVASLSSLLFVAQLYPLTSAGLYLKGGLGIGRNAIDFDGGFDVGDTGFAGLVGAGYELRLGRRLYLTPTLDLVGHSYSGRVKWLHRAPDQFRARHTLSVREVIGSGHYQPHVGVTILVHPPLHPGQGQGRQTSRQ